MIVHSFNEPDNNPYAERGFKRGHDVKPKLKKFLCCFNLSLGILFSSVYDIVQVMVWLTLVLAHAKAIQWPFYLTYTAILITRLYYFYKFNRQDTEPIRYDLYRVHRASTLVLGLL